MALGHRLFPPPFGVHHVVEAFAQIASWVRPPRCHAAERLGRWETLTVIVIVAGALLLGATWGILVSPCDEVGVCWSQSLAWR